MIWNKFPKLKKEVMQNRLQSLKEDIKNIPVVIDTDAYNEIDDQFALVYAFLTKERFDIKAVYAAPFLNSRSNSPEDGMLKSYDEIHRVLDILKYDKPRDNLVFKGSNRYLESCDTPCKSPAVNDLIEIALRHKDSPLYVLAMGAMTNIASALLIEPPIVKNIVLVWLGTNSPSWGKQDEFNFRQDILAAQIIFNSNVPLVLIPCSTVAQNLSISLLEMALYVKGCGEIGDYLYDIFHKHYENHYQRYRVIWDISTIAWMINPGWVRSDILLCPYLKSDGHFGKNQEHLYRLCYWVDRCAIFHDFFSKLPKGSENISDRLGDILAGKRWRENS